MLPAVPVAPARSGDEGEQSCVGGERSLKRRAAFTAAVEADASFAGKSPAAKALAAQLMDKYDRNQDGVFDLGEVVDIVEDVQAERKAKDEARRMNWVLGRVVIVAVVALVAVVGVNAGLTWHVVDTSKDTDTSNDAHALTDRDNNIVATRPSELKLPLLAGPILPLETLATTDRLVVRHESGDSTVTASLKVSDVTKYSNTHVAFHLNLGGKVEILNGAATYTDREGIVHQLCEADVTCSAFTAEEATSSSLELLAAADAALEAAGFPRAAAGDGRRRPSRRATAHGPAQSTARTASVRLRRIGQASARIVAQTWWRNRSARRPTANTTRTAPPGAAGALASVTCSLPLRHPLRHRRRRLRHLSRAGLSRHRRRRRCRRRRRRRCLHRRFLRPLCRRRHRLRRLLLRLLLRLPLHLRRRSRPLHRPQAIQASPSAQAPIS